MIIHNEFLRPLLRDTYREREIRELREFLEARGTFQFRALQTGLFPAAQLSERGAYTGYAHCWVRDNIHVAHAHHVVRQTGVAVQNAEALFRYFQKHRSRWEKIIREEADAAVAMNRPHIRFDGENLEEIDEPWSHAQNDALGYFLWFYCQLAREGRVAVGADQWAVLGLFPLFFQAVRYWEDDDSGHWEEARKVEASSIGVVVAALEMLRRLMIEQSVAALAAARRRITIAGIEELIRRGRAALATILPAECIQPGRERPYDSALLFLIYPVDIADDGQAQEILAGVENHLQGAYGIRRYLGDSFWCANYDEVLAEEARTKDFSQDMSARDALLKPGEEAQWCLFDPLVSVIYGRRFERTRDKSDAARQFEYLNRSLAQLTSADSGFPELLCPELYYLKGNRYLPNDVTPLLWTQANLLIALHYAQQTARRIG